MITEVSPTRYVVKINGRIVGLPQPTRPLAEAFILSLPVEQRTIAEIVPVSVDGKELLLG